MKNNQDNNTPSLFGKETYDSIGEFIQGVAIVVKDDKYGAILMGGHEIIAPEYDYISSFRDGYAQAIRKGETKILDLSGRECKEYKGKMIAIPSKYDVVRDFKDGFACVGIKPEWGNIKWGVIDENCKEIFEPEFHYISDFTAGTAKYQEKSSQYANSWGFLSSDGYKSKCNLCEDEIEILPDGTINICRDEYSTDSNGKVFVDRTRGHNPTRKVRINNHGQLVVNIGPDEISLPIEYRLVKSFSNGLFCVQDSTGYWGIINRNGQIVIPLEYIKLKDFIENKTFGLNKQGQLCLISINGIIIKTFEGYSGAQSFKNGFAVIMQGDKEGLINQKGDILLEPIDACIYHSDTIGEFRLSSSGKIGLFNSSTGLLIKPRYSKIIKVEKDFVLVEVHGIGESYIDFSGRAFINKDSRIYLPEWCLGAKELVDDFYIGISEEEKWGIIDKQGESLCQPIYDYIGTTIGDIVQTENHETIYTGWGYNKTSKQLSKYGLFNLKSKVSIPAVYDCYPQYENFFYRTTKNDLVGAVNLKGIVVLETKWKSIEYQKGYYIISDILEVDYSKEEKYGIASAEGKIIFKPQFDSVSVLKKGLFKVKNNDSWTLYDEFDKLSDDTFDEMYSIQKGVIKVSQEGRIGHINLSGKKVILSENGKYIELPSRFSWGEDFKNGIAKVWIAGHENYVNSSFDLVLNNDAKVIVLDSQIQYIEKRDFNNNYVFVSDSQRGLISMEGDVLIPAHYEKIIPLKSNVYVVSLLIDSKEKYGVINVEETTIIPIEYTSIEPYGGEVPFRGLVDTFDGWEFYEEEIDIPEKPEYWLIGKDDKYGLLGVNLMICIPTIYDDIKQFDYGFFVKVARKWGVLNEKYEIITEPKYDKIETIENDFYQVSIVTQEASYYNDYHERREYGILDKYGCEKLEPIYYYVKGDNSDKLPENRFFICLKGRIGIIDHKYNILAEPIYESISDFEEGKAMVRKAMPSKTATGLTFVIGELDTDGNFIELQELTKYDIAQGLSDNTKVTILSRLNNNLIVVRKEHSNSAYQYCAIINKSNEVILPYKYHDIQEMENGSFLVKLNGQYGVLSKELNEIIQPVYQSIQLVNNLYLVDKGSWWADRKYGLINFDGNSILDCEYSSIQFAASGLIWITKDKQIGLAKDDGSLLIEPKFGKVEQFSDGYALVNCGHWSYDEDERSYDYIEGKWGVINTEGKEVLPAIYSTIEYEPENMLFKVSRQLGWTGPKVSGYVNTEGNLIIKDSEGRLISASEKFAWQENFVNGLSIVYNYNGLAGKVNDNMQLLVTISKDGEPKSVLLPEEYEWGYDSENCYIIVEKNRKKGIVDEEGKQIIGCQFDSINPVSESDIVLFFCGIKKEKVKYSQSYDWSIINKDGKDVFERVLSGYKLLGKGLIALRNEEGKYAVADFAGKILSGWDFDDVKEFGVSTNINSDFTTEALMEYYAKWVKKCEYSPKKDINLKYALVEISGRFGVINKFAHIIIPPKYESLIILDNGTFIADKCELINTRCERVVSNGNTTIPISEEYDDEEYLGNGFVKVKKDGLFGCINRFGEIIIPIIYDSLSYYNDLFIVSKYDKDYGINNHAVINFQNEQIVPFDEKYCNIIIKNGIIMCQKTYNRWGAYSLQGDLICGPKYDDTFHYITNNLIKVRQEIYDNKLGEGLIDSHGNEIISPDSGIEVADNIVDGLVAFRCDERVGFIDAMGNLVLKLKYESIGSFVDGYAIVSRVMYGSFYDDNNHYDEISLYGVINCSFKEIIPCVFKKMQYERESGLFKTEVGYKTLDGRFIADYNGKPVFIDNKYIYCKEFINDCAISVRTEKDSIYYGLINPKSEDILPPIYNGLKLVGDRLYRFKLNDKFGLIDDSGNIVLPNIYDGLGEFEEGLALLVVKDGPGNNDENKLYGYVDSKGSIVLPPEYNFMGKRCNSHAVVMKDSVWGLFSLLNHDVTIMEEATYLGPYMDGLCRINIGGIFNTTTKEVKLGNWGFVDVNGQMVIEPEYDRVLNFHDGIAAIKSYGQWGFINKENQKIVPCEYDDIESGFSDGEGKLIKDGEIYVFDTQGNLVRTYKQRKDDYYDYDDDYTPSYDKYGGYNGYDDQTIDEAFGGDPSATWNID